MAATAFTPKAQKSERMRGMHPEGVGPPHGAANKLLCLSQVEPSLSQPEVSTRAHLLPLPDAAKLSQVLPLPQKNHTEENFPDLEVLPSASSQMGTCSAEGTGDARGQQGRQSQQQPRCEGCLKWRGVRSISPELLEGGNRSPTSVSTERGCSLPESANPSSDPAAGDHTF